MIIYKYNGKEYTSLYLIRKSMPNIIFPKNPTNELLNSLGIEIITIKPSLENEQTKKINELKLERDAKEVEPIEYNGKFFDYDDKARDRINAAIIALEQLGEEASLAWTTANNTEVMVTAQDLKNVISTVAVRSNNLHIAYRDAKEAVEAAEDEETLNSIKLEDYIPSLEVLTEQ